MKKPNRDDLRVKVFVARGIDVLTVNSYDLIEYAEDEDLVEALIEDLLTSLKEAENAN